MKKASEKEIPAVSATGTLEILLTVNAQLITELPLSRKKNIQVSDELQASRIWCDLLDLAASRLCREARR